MTIINFIYMTINGIKNYKLSENLLHQLIYVHIIRSISIA
jgi:hypothetical protein